MKRLTVLLMVLLSANCAPRPVPVEPEAFMEACADDPRVRSSVTESERQFRTRSCAFIRATLVNYQAERAWRENRARATAIVFGAAGDALSEHNFYVYDVPNAAQYLRGDIRRAR